MSERQPVEKDAPDRYGCCGCGGRLRAVVGANFYTCDTLGCGGNVSRFDRIIPPEGGKS